MISIVVV